MLALHSCPTCFEAAAVDSTDLVIFAPTSVVVVAAAELHLGNSACSGIHLGARGGRRLRDDLRDDCSRLDCPCLHGGCNACRRPSDRLNASYTVVKILASAA